MGSPEASDGGWWWEVKTPYPVPRTLYPVSPSPCLAPHPISILPHPVRHTIPADVPAVSAVGHADRQQADADPGRVLPLPHKACCNRTSAIRGTSSRTMYIVPLPKLAGGWSGLRGPLTRLSFPPPAPEFLFFFLAQVPFLSPPVPSPHSTSGLSPSLSVARVRARPYPTTGLSPISFVMGNPCHSAACQAAADLELCSPWWRPTTETIPRKR